MEHYGAPLAHVARHARRARKNVTGFAAQGGALPCSGCTQRCTKMMPGDRLAGNRHIDVATKDLLLRNKLKKKELGFLCHLSLIAKARLPDPVSIGSWCRPPPLRCIYVLVRHTPSRPSICR